jgi:hypothetical protein
MNLGFRWFIPNMARQLWKGCGLNHLKWHQRLEHGLYAWAEAGQAWRYIMDRFHRFRKPFVMYSRQKCKV